MLDRTSLPAVQDTAPLDPDVIDGQVVDEPGTRPVIVLKPVVQVVSVVLVVVKHEHTKTAGRHAAYVAAGVVVAARRWHRARTRHERMMRAAEAAGDHESALEWARQAETERHQRHERRVKRAEVALAVAVASPVIGAVLVAGMVAFGILLWIAGDGPRGMAWPWVTIAHAVKFAIEVAPTIALAAVIGVPLAVLLVLHHLGRHAGDLAPRWAMAAKLGDEGSGIIVTADTIVLALQNLDKIPALKRAFKDAWRPTFTLLPVRDGRGYSAVFSLPLGVTPDMIADQRPVLARNLHREEVETWPSSGPPGFASLWVADSGAISKDAPEYPLLHEGTADVFEGVPGGVVARGDAALIPVVANNLVLGGQMGQGKSNAARVFMLGCALDPLAELNVFVFAGNGDFDSFAPRLAVYRKGTGDDVIETAVARLYALNDEVGRREARLAELGAKKVTRGLAEAHRDLRPVVVLFSECHELFGHAGHGGVAGELAVKVIKRARKTGITLVFDTQSSRAAAIPPALVELVSVNACFYVKTWRSNDGFLGDGSFQAGIRATELRPGRDRGTSVVTGISDSQFELLKWFYVEVDDDTGYDAATDVIARAMAQLAPGTPVEATSPVIAIEARDLLDDLAEVLQGEDGPVRLADLPPRLRRIAPAWAAYRSLTGTQLRELLDHEDIKTTRAGNVPRLDPDDLHRVRRLRSELGRPGRG